MRDRLSRPLYLVLLLATTAAVLGAPALAQAPPSLPDLEDEVMCPTCGTALGLSESPQADQIRDQIRALIADGRSEAEIKDELVAEYGSEVLATPQGSGFDLLAWLLPGAGLLLAASALAVGVRRWRAAGAADAERPMQGGDPDPDDEDRLEADLGRYRL